MYSHAGGFELLEASVTKRDQTEFGRVHGGYLKVRVSVMSLRDLVSQDEDAAKAIVKDGLLKCNHEWVSAFWDTDNREAEEDLVNDASLLRIEPLANVLTGLLVYPADGGGEFYRLGYWQADYKGAKSVTWETTTITLIGEL